MADKSPTRIRGAIGFRNVFSLALVSFFTDASTEMVLGVLPLFILEEVGGTRAILGVIEGLAEAVSNVMRLASGFFSDRLGMRKAFVLIGYTLSTATKPFFAFARTWGDALAVRVFDRMGKGVRTSPRDALLSESVQERRVGTAFGLHRSLDQAGAVVGPGLAFILIPLLGLRGVFLASLVPGLAAVLILLLFVEERRGKPRAYGLLQDARKVLKGRFTVFLLVMGLFSVGAFNFSFVLVRARDFGVGLAFAPIVYAVINIAHSAVGLPAGVIADRIGKERVLLSGCLSFLAASLVGMSSLASPFHAYLMAVFYGFYMGILEAIPRAMIPGYSGSELRGTAYGVYSLSAGLCFLTANIVFGALWDILGATAAFTYSMITTVAAMIGLIILGLKKRP